MLSSYLLFIASSDSDVDTVLSIFNSDSGKKVISDTVEELQLIRSYAKNIYTVIPTKMKDSLPADIAYSYHNYSNTGELKRLSYSDRTDDFTYDASDKIFNMRTFQAYSVKLSNPDMFEKFYKMYKGLIPLPLDADTNGEFTEFLEEWLKDNNAIIEIDETKPFKAYGYNNNKFGLVIEVNGLSTSTKRLLTALLGFVNSNVEYVDKLIQKMQAIVNTPTTIETVLGENYNALNKSHISNKNGIEQDNTQWVLKKRQDSLIERYNSMLHRAKNNTQLEDYYSSMIKDCHKIFNAVQQEESTIRPANSAQDFISNNSMWLVKETGYGTNDELTNAIDSFINLIYTFIAGTDYTKIYLQSIAGLVKLYAKMYQYNIDVVNMYLDLNLSEYEYQVAENELLNKFCIPFVHSLKQYMESIISMNLSITQSETIVSKPTKNLLLYTYRSARIMQSKMIRRTVRRVNND